MELNLKVANSKKELNKEVIDLGFLSSSDIHTLESGIKTSKQASNKLQLSICLALAKIEQEQLFKQIGCKNMYQYLREQTNFNYSTAREYVYMGKNFLKLQKELEKVTTDNQEFILGKLRYLPSNYDDFSQKDKENILEKIKTETSRAFKLYIANNFGQKTNARNNSKKDVFNIKQVMHMELTKTMETIEKKSPKTKEEFIRLLNLFCENSIRELNKFKSAGRLK